MIQQTKQEDVILFEVSDKTFGIPVEIISEIIRPLHVNKLPLAPSAVEGLIRVREGIYSLVNLENLLDLTHLEATEEDERFLLVKCLDTSVAIRVNRVNTLTTYQSSELTQNENGDSTVLSQYTKGSFTHHDDSPVYLLSLEAIFESLKLEAKKITS